MKTLFARLCIALLAIVTLAGGAFFAVEQFSTRNYHEEITQRLNASIAMYVTGERQLMENGRVNRDALELLAQQAMIINPTVEVYLLDTGGRILAHAMPPESILSDHVDLAPVEKLMSGKANMPLRGTDPRSHREKVFSAHPVMHEGKLQGYLYAVLGGQKYDELASSIRGSYVQRVSLGAFIAIIGVAFAVGLVVMHLLTRRLARLAGDVRRFTDTGFDPAAAPALRDGAGPPPEGDEISQLRTAFSRMADKIVEQVDRLRETDRLRRELISNVSHDLRTPLSSMHGYVDTLLIKNEELSAEERRHYLDITRKHTHRLGQLIGDLFDLSRLEASSIEPDLETFSLGELLQDVTQEFELDAQERGIRIKVEGDPSGSQVYADIGLMQRVLENLIRNALKYTPVGGEITVTLDPGRDRLAVAVADTGCGIPEKDLEHIFERYYRSADGDGHTHESAGLGLAIVHKILQLHGSTITVESRLDQGTRFQFDLPLRRAA